MARGKRKMYIALLSKTHYRMWTDVILCVVSAQSRVFSQEKLGKPNSKVSLKPSLHPQTGF